MEKYSLKKLIAVIGVIGALAWGTVYVVKGIASTPGEEIDKSVGIVERLGKLAIKGIETVKDVLTINPKVTIGSETVVEASNNIAELAVAQKEFTSEYSFEHTHLGSTKTIVVRGIFIAKAGYRFESPMEINFKEDLSRASLVLPHAELLSLETKEIEYYGEDGGLWNPVNDGDRTAAQNGILRVARQAILKTSLLKDADESTVMQIQKKIHEALPDVDIKRVIP